MSARQPPFLSIVIPFHDSTGKCEPLLETLSQLDPEDGVELIFVDDGSSDDTLQILRSFAKSSRTNTFVVERENGGPGAARNSGLDRASGRFVWFVDSDDDINLGAIAMAKRADWPEVDLIAWEFDHPAIRRGLSPGLHTTSGAPAPPDAFDPIVANWFSMDFLKRTGLRFPEYCVYEATPVEAFVLPLLVLSYFKSDFVAYRASVEHASVTRGVRRFDPRLYDRLQTVSLGMAFVDRAELKPNHRAMFEAAYAKLFLWYSIRLSKLPNRSWLLAARVMQKFRDDARRFNISGDPFAHYEGRRASRLVLRMLWRMSAILPVQTGYFDGLHMQTWRRKIRWDLPKTPARWSHGVADGVKVHPFGAISTAR
jgi:glycosyltransferase involved in cell wall biosynthesis